jgi:hypothetical protein
VVCPAGTMQCVCVPLRDVPAWRCVDLGADSNGFGGASIGIDFGGSGGPGFGAGTGGTFGIAGREGSSFGGIRTEFQF